MRIFPTEIRAGAVGVGTSLSRIGAAVGTWLVPLSLQNIGIGPTMHIAAAITFFGLIVSWFMAPETNARSLEDASSLEEELPRNKVSMQGSCRNDTLFDSPGLHNCSPIYSFTNFSTSLRRLRNELGVSPYCLRNHEMRCDASENPVAVAISLILLLESAISFRACSNRILRQ